MNDKDLPVPARRPLPRDVHDRLRTRVLGGLAPERRSRIDRIRQPLAVAASVAVLAAGTAIVTQSVGGFGGDDPISAPGATATPEPPPLDPVAAKLDLDRCFAAVQAAGRATLVPDRGTWEPVFAVSNEGRTLTAARAAGRPLFCETTMTSVTVSDPDAQPVYATGAGTAALMISRNAAIGGVVDPASSSMTVLSVSAAGAPSGGLAIIKDGMFVQFGPYAVKPGARFTVRRTVPGNPDKLLPSDLELPPAPPPLVAATDRPVSSDRSSAKGAFLGECIAKSDNVVVDPEAWEAVVLLGEASAQLVLARAGDQIGTCSSAWVGHNPDDPNEETTRFQFVRARPQDLARDHPIVFFATPMSFDSDSIPVVGLVRADVVSMEVVTPAGATPVSAENGAFGALFPDLFGNSNVTVVLRDGTGTELYQGPLRNSR